MSWNFRYSGTNKDKVKEAIQKEQYCPQALRNALCDLVDSRDLAAADGKQFAVHIESDGHVDSAYGYGKFTCNRVTMVD